MHSSQNLPPSQYPQDRSYPQTVPYSSAPQSQARMLYPPNSQPQQQGSAMPAGVLHTYNGYYQPPHGGVSGFGVSGKKRSKGRLAAIITAISLVLGCTGVAIAGIIKNGSPFGLFMPSGASTAEGSLLNLADAIDAENLKGAFGAFSPAEMKYVMQAGESLSGESDDIFTPLKEMAEALDVSLKELEYDEFELNEKMVAFRIDGGKVDIDVQDEDAVIEAVCDLGMLGEEGMNMYLYHSSRFSKQQCVEELRDTPEIYEGVHGSFSRDRYQTVSVVSVQENGRWYISPWLSILMNSLFSYEALYNNYFPDVKNIETEHYSSAHKALEGVTEAIEERDMWKIVKSLPEEERRVFALISAYDDDLVENIEWHLPQKIDFGDTVFHEEPVSYGSSLVLEELYVSSYDTPRFYSSDSFYASHPYEVSVSVDNGNLELNDNGSVCSVDVSDGESSLLVLGSVKDREGWHLSVAQTSIGFLLDKDGFSGAPRKLVRQMERCGWL